MGTAKESLSSPPEVLASKLSLPDLNSFAVARPGVMRRFDEGHRVVVVGGPPGYGKTTAARQWVDSQGDAVGWLSLDVLDNRPAMFWSHFVVALEDAIPDIRSDDSLSFGVDRPVDELLSSLFNRVEQCG